MYVPMTDPKAVSRCRVMLNELRRLKQTRHPLGMTAQRRLINGLSLRIESLFTAAEIAAARNSDPRAAALAYAEQKYFINPEGAERMIRWAKT